VTLGNMTGVVALTWKFGANGYTAMNLMGAWFKRRCTARGGDAAISVTTASIEIVFIVKIFQNTYF